MDPIKKLASADVQDFIFENERMDVNKLLLKEKSVVGLPTALVASQLKAREKASYKLPTLHSTKGIIYPPTINLEQSSSEATAWFKSVAIERLLKKRSKFCDLTSGFGIDAMFFSKVFDSGEVVDPNKELIATSRHNYDLLGIKNLGYHAIHSEVFLADNEERFDLIYIDPSRRTDSKERIFRLSDCEPDVIELQESIFEHSDWLLVKASPLFDIQQGQKELQGCFHVFVVAVDNDCKELLFLCKKGSTKEPFIECVNFRNNDRKTSEGLVFRLSEEREAAAPFADPGKYLYEPNASILKGGAFKTIGVEYGLDKIHGNTHLYTSNDLVTDFPGRTFEIVEFVKPDKKLRETFPRGQANILLRNYPSSVEELKRKTGLKDGGELYLIGCSGLREKWLMVAKRLG